MSVRRLVGILVTVSVAIQFVPVTRTNPPVEQDIRVPPAVRAILERSCYDCHSHRTRWPWYSRIAPVSWLVARDVREGRRHLNFSTWNRLSDEQARKARAEIAEEAGEGGMPPWFYLPLHPDARLSAEDRAVLARWVGPGGDHEDMD